MAHPCTNSKCLKLASIFFADVIYPKSLNYWPVPTSISRFPNFFLRFFSRKIHRKVGKGQVWLRPHVLRIYLSVAQLTLSPNRFIILFFLVFISILISIGVVTNGETAIQNPEKNFLQASYGDEEGTMFSVESVKSLRNQESQTKENIPTTFQ